MEIDEIIDPGWGQMTSVMYDSGLLTVLGDRYGSVCIIYGPAKNIET